MIMNSQTWLRLARRISDPRRADWLDAMSAECAHLDDPKQQSAFAAGCFKAALSDTVRTRRGLSAIARLGGALIILLMSGFGFGVALKLSGTEFSVPMAALVAGLCVFYAICAMLLAASLRGLRFVALAGFIVALGARLYLGMAAPELTASTSEFLKALSFEMAGLMTGFIMASVWLGWLYDPSLNDG